MLTGFFGGARRPRPQVRDRLESHHQVYVALAINVAGALLLGVLIGAQPADRLRVVLGVGYLASFTTFSTFVSQVYHAIGDDRYATGFTLPLLSVVLGVVAVWVGVSPAAALRPEQSAIRRAKRLSSRYARFPPRANPR